MISQLLGLGALRMRAVLRRLGCDQSAVTAIEYALIAALISIGIFGATQTIGSSVSSFFQKLATSW